jgi:hypothetical protein
MAITDPRAIKFSNEVIRPISERMRDLFEDIARADQAWRDEIGALIPNDSAEILNDGRTAEGVSILDGAEINSIRTVWKNIADFRSGVATAAVPNIDTKLTRACVRTLRS